MAVGGLVPPPPLLFLLLGGDCFSAFWSMRFKMSVLRRAGTTTFTPLRMEDTVATDVGKAAHEMMMTRANADDDDDFMIMV